MPILAERLAALPQRHRQALEWFIQRAGTVQPWPDPLPDGTLLASHREGIYKPAWGPYALSVRQNIGGPYPDYDPEINPDGTWTYLYLERLATVRADRSMMSLIYGRGVGWGGELSSLPERFTRWLDAARRHCRGRAAH